MELQDLVDWMKANGVRRLRTADGVELEMARDVQYGPATEARKPKTDEERATEARERKRRRYEKELGRTLTDAQLAGLP